MKGAILLGLAVVLLISVSETSAFCGGCGCNIFGCNCDWTPQQCRHRSARKVTFPVDAQHVMDLADSDKDGSISSEEAAIYFQNVNVIKKAFDLLDTDENGKITLEELDHKH
jgi:hypothetical protein